MVPATNDTMDAVLSCQHTITHESITLYFDPAQEGNNALAQLHQRLAAALHAPAVQTMDAQTIRHISALSELVRMPNAEHFADAHNAAVRHLRVIAAQAKQGG